MRAEACGEFVAEGDGFGAAGREWVSRDGVEVSGARPQAQVQEFTGESR